MATATAKSEVTVTDPQQASPAVAERYEEQKAWLNDELYSIEEKHNLHRQILVAYTEAIKQSSLQIRALETRAKYTHTITDSFLNLTTLKAGGSVFMSIVLAPPTFRGFFNIEHKPSDEELGWTLSIGTALGVGTGLVIGYLDYRETPEQRVRKAYNAAVKELEPHIREKMGFENKVQQLEIRLNSTLSSQQRPTIDVWNKQQRTQARRHYEQLFDQNDDFKPFKETMVEFISACRDFIACQRKINSTQQSLTDKTSTLSKVKKNIEELKRDLREASSATSQLTAQKPLEKQQKLSHKLTKVQVEQTIRDLKTEETKLNAIIERLTQQLTDQKMELEMKKTAREEALEKAATTEQNIKTKYPTAYAQVLAPSLYLTELDKEFNTYDDTLYQHLLKRVVEIGVEDWLIHGGPDIPIKVPTFIDESDESIIKYIVSRKETTS